MSHRRPQRYREPDLVSWSQLSGVLIVFGVALLLGLVSGGLYIAWRLLDLHVLR